MQLFYLFILAGVFVLLGLFYVLKGLKNGVDEQKVTPISDPNEIRDYKKSYEASQKSLMSQTVAEHIIKENVELKTQLAVQEKSSIFEKELQTLRSKVEELSRENILMQKVIEQEQVKTSQNVPSLLQQTQIELARLKEINDGLSTENSRIIKLWEEDKRTLEKAQSHVQALEKQLSQITAQDHARIQSLEDEVTKFTKDQEATVYNKQVLDKLSAENQDLLFQIKEKESALEKLSLEKERLFVNFEIKTKELNERAEELYKKLSDEETETVRIKYKELQTRYEELHAEKDFSDSQMVKLRDEIKNLQAMQEIMQEREQFLQYELTKAKAQLLGLERLCEDFKTQIESTHN